MVETLPYEALSNQILYLIYAVLLYLLHSALAVL